MRSVTETELAILQVLWDAGQCTSREVTQALYGEVSDPKLSSAQKLLERLEWKECVTRDRTCRPHRFRATVSREQFADRHVQALADKLYGGSLSPVLTSLIQSRTVSKAELDELRSLIDRLSVDRSDAPPKKRRPRKR